MPISQMAARSYGRAALDLRDEARAPALEGARAALESFYFAFNQRSLAALEGVWAPGPLSALANPLGGIVRGIAEIRALYQRIFDGPARVWVEFYDVVEYVGEESVVFAGRERGEFTRAALTLPLAIRTTRVFQYFGDQLGWRQVHHHGSIDDPATLGRYQAAVREA
ncbi:MAG: DUF4440 domain-containing protein [Nitrospirae bacterium CG18_big_fil_WC_8_21_14_2_50_70_55]|nr:nuclear transport factor 2 family protein [Deltaproteobacteria bacterium]OIP65634.1 MAG: DUF4440 domain-containing protein [Nitrospirae bacterium CG2_30_70_394]PIQ07308.1 MAG: DUF4440 domain-containing protein [Nitrospirae bacterium CG18_big_fil_WC_8_21_14_2_50_70_55]PIU80260.1 MAG: DUF4440 domain-containing protein [Nitrospirae bacterium CG06_land_8_20_14_3_00_70_43]PIW82718.1 MAG: DUF4440 domain-containing protein [Nitrospirae bacterium CG_4_8_14_3_um_filter_70_85]PIX83078.1 MAG: DUF4440 